MCVDLHRHDEFSSFDGFGKAKVLAKLAKKKGLTALGIANHGNMNGVVEHWKACLEEDIKPILGVEAYFQPKYDKTKEKKATFHMCLFAKNLKGYQNLNRIMSQASLEQRYYTNEKGELKQYYGGGVIDFDLLKQHNEGVIATSGCVASFISQMIIKGRMDIVDKTVKKFVSIYGKDFYIEIQPYELEERDDESKESFEKRKQHYNLQRLINIELINIAKKFKLHMVLTSDSHYGSENDYDTYKIMHNIKGSGEFNDTYKERYMPERNDLYKRFCKMHKDDFTDVKMVGKRAMKGLLVLEESVEMDILGQLELHLPVIDDNSKELLWEKVKQGLKQRGRTTKEYIQRAKFEYDVITHHGFEDYFLIVQDYTNYAKRNFKAADDDTKKFWKKFITTNGYDRKAVKVGPGRGSVCNSLVAYALGITEVDSLKFDLDFDRFMRKDKKKLPDIDLDFHSDRRDEVIKYVVERYPGKAAQICSYGLYKTDNLINDLIKVCVNDLDDPKKPTASDKVKLDIAKQRVKEYVKTKMVNDEINFEDFSHERDCINLNKEYNDIIKHFCKMYNKVRYLGTHAGGVAVVGSDLLDYCSIELRGSMKDGYQRTTSYNLENLEIIQVVKFDMLGLRTLSITEELEDLTDECFSYEWLEDPEIYEYFAAGQTDGIFQFEKDAAKNIFRGIEASNFNDVVAVTALNRPGPLSMKMHELFAHNKLEGVEKKPWSKYTEKSYGTIIFQEQATRIAREIGGLDLDDTDKILKIIKSESNLDKFKDDIDELRKKFVKGAMQTSKLSKDEAADLFNLMIVYSFNEGHATGYGIISLQQMYYKVHHPELFWYVTLKYTEKDDALYRLKEQAVVSGNVILIAHVNYGAKFSRVEVDGEMAIAEGLSNIKGVGEKAADAIEEERIKNGKFKSKDDFIQRMSYKGSPVKSNVITKLEEAGSLVFNKKTYFERVKSYNTNLYLRGMNNR